MKICRSFLVFLLEPSEADFPKIMSILLCFLTNYMIFKPVLKRLICGQFYVKIAGTIQQKPTFIHTLLVAVCHFTFSVVLIKKKIN